MSPQAIGSAAPILTTDRIEQLKRKLAARENQPGFKDNVAAIRAEIERLERAATP